MIYDVIDNVLSKELSEEIYNVMLGDSFAWHYSSAIAYEENNVDNLFYMTHNFYSGNRPNSHLFDRWYSEFENVLSISALLRMKGNLYPSQKQLNIHPSHIDLPDIPNIGAIYYVNDNDGYTIIGDKKIASIKNRLLVFDAHVPHSSTDCTNTKCRVNINFNFLGYNK